METKLWPTGTDIQLEEDTMNADGDQIAVLDRLMTDPETHQIYNRAWVREIAPGKYRYLEAVL
jgi:hypothetical protein